MANELAEVRTSNFDENWIYVDENHVRAIHNFYNNHHICERCSTILLDHSLGEGFTLKNKTISDTDRQHWVWFLQEFFLNLFKFGYCVYYIDQKKQIPIVSPPMSTTIRYTKDIYKYKVQVLEYYTRKVLKKHYVFVDSLPDTNGSVISPVAKALLAQVENNKIINYAMEQERKKAHPRVYGLNKDKNPSARIMINSQNDLSYGVTKGIMKETFEKIEEEQTKLDFSNLKTTPIEIEEIPFDRLETVTSQPSSINLVEINRQYRQQICTSLGVPSSFIVDDSVVKVNTEGTTVSFFSSLNKWKFKLSEAIVIIWEKIFNTDEITISDIHLLGYLYGKDVEYLFETRILKESVMKTVFSRRFHIPTESFTIPKIEIEAKASLSDPNQESVTKKRKLLSSDERKKQNTLK